MKTATSFFGRVRRIWSEMDYAQRRVFEMRTGIRTPSRAEREIDELEHLFSLGARRL